MVGEEGVDEYIRPRGACLPGGLPMRGGGGEGNLCRVFNFMLCTFRTFSVLLASDMTWAAAGASQALRASGLRTHRTLDEPQPIGRI